ncbi:10988_t:CDS:1, partial [Cetraspora pellucida]
YLISQMTTHNSYQSSFFDSNMIAFSNKNKIRLDESIASDVLENLYSLDTKLNSSIPDQSTSHNSSIT